VLLAQQPAPRSYVIEGARIVSLAGPPIETGTVVVRDGRIAAVGATAQAPPGAERIDGKGLHLYPGFFDAVTALGLTEIGQVAATVDVNEIGAFNPQLVAAAAVHPASELIPVARANGITHAGVVPGLSSGQGAAAAAITIGGQASAIHLAGWTIEDMLVTPSLGLLVNWPRLSTTSFDTTTFSQRQRPFTEVKQEYDKRVTELGDWIERARRYAQAIKAAPAATARDLKLEALARVVSGEWPLLVNANSKRQITDAVAFCTSRSMRMVLLGGDDAREVAELLKKHSIPVILGPSQALPTNEDEPYDAAYALAGDLHKAGLAVSISTFNSSDSRTLPYEAGHAVGYGLAWEDALRAITINPARALGLADRLGTLEPGKIANLVVTSGDPLEIRTEVRYVFVNGRPVSLDNRHLESYERWRSRPRPAAPTR
jgi:imidazolonepropionase-like amidohydrolase